jgi:signal transduction histidine kinase
LDYKNETNQHIFSFTDNGIGIANEYHEKIFGMFERLHSNPNIIGSGIGLAMTKRIVERLGGSIGLTSKLGKGSTFFVKLPMKKS